LLGTSLSDASSRLQRRPPQPRAEDLSDCRTSFAVAGLGEGEPWEIAREAAEPEARVIPASLPHARVGALAGFLEIVAERGGRVDLHRVAGELHLDVRDLLPLVDAAVLLGWVQVQEGDAILSPEGRSFVEAPVLARKELFRTALQQRPTLVMRIHAALSGKANRRLSESFFRGLLEQHFQCGGGSPAARHGDRLGTLRRAFGFEDDTNELFLEPVE
jgi:NitT/TauT family transport system ATP-binding protein